jgi:hypothetical protein
MGATAFLTPDWRFIVFLTAVYIITGSYLLTLPTSSSLAGLNIVVFLGVIALGITAGVAAALIAGAISSPAGSWAAGGAFLATTVAGAYVTGVLAPFVIFAQVVSFSGLGFPVIVQLALAIPCTIIFAWQVLAFVAAFGGIGGSTTGGSGV